MMKSKKYHKQVTCGVFAFAAAVAAATTSTVAAVKVNHVKNPALADVPRVLILVPGHGNRERWPIVSGSINTL